MGTYPEIQKPDPANTSLLLIVDPDTVEFQPKEGLPMGIVEPADQRSPGPHPLGSTREHGIHSRS